MEKLYKNLLGVCVAGMATLNAMAIDPPFIGQKLTEGGTYILVNFANPSQVWSRTSWDGAYYLRNLSVSDYMESTLTAHQTESGEWYFEAGQQTEIVEDEETGEQKTVEYMVYAGIPAGTDNLNSRFREQALWIVESVSGHDGWYMLKAAEGQGNALVIGKYLHLNSGCEYVVITEESNGWFPDAYGGIASTTVVDEDENVDVVYEMEEDGVNFKFNDPTSRYWAFVLVDDINQDYINKCELYKAIVAAEKDYASLSGYEAGFKIAIDAATEVYGRTEFYAEDLDEGMEILNVRTSLYREILAAEELLADSEDAVFTAAIQTAKSSFNTVTGVAEVNAAIETLKQAEVNFSLGNGEITALGQNMSFEDLSAQGGNMTTSVANPPAGWSLYVNGTQVTSESEIRSAGIGGWCGVNDDCDGDVKHGNYGFGIWNGGIPEVELSQTITGLENGTYVVSAGLMAGANGNGSRLTTQRIFGNLNSTYFASEYAYNASELDQTEVYDFAGNDETYVTDRTLFEVVVRAYVYDGTLTFGLRTNGNIKAANRESGNGAGGDGWFKVDNFRIMKEGFNKADALAVYEHFKDILLDVKDQKMQKSVKQEVDDAIANNTVDETSEEEKINDAILAFRDEYVVAKESADAYTRLTDAIEQHYDYLNEYGNYPGAPLYQDAIMDAETMYDDAVADEKAIDAMIASLEQALQDCKQSEITVGKDITDLIVNPSFEDFSTQGNNDTSGGVENVPKGWNLYIDGNQMFSASDISAAGIANWCAINKGDAISVDTGEEFFDKQPTDGDHLWGIWTANMPEVELSQTLTKLPAGTYTLSIDVMVENNWAGNNITTQRIFANNSVQMFSTSDSYENNLPEDAAAAQAIDESLLTFADYLCESGDPTTSLLHTMTLTFGVDESGEATFGFRTNGINSQGLTFAEGGVNGQGWFKIDNVRLTYDSAEVPTGVKGMETGAATQGKTVARQFFSVSGARMTSPQKGVNVIRDVKADGSVTTSKVLVK